MTARQSFAGIQSVFTALASLGVGAIFQDIARRSIDAAVAVDRQVNSLKALTGSAELATKRFRELVQLAQRTPGLTTNLATTLDAQLRVFSVAEQTINRLLPVIGKLNAIAPLGDPRQFVNNLTQLISQNFEKSDLKELVGASPIAGKLIAEIFNVDNPTNAKAIREAAKRMGVTTVERLADELVRAAGNNKALQNVTETLAGQFEKMQDRITLALAPIGDALIKTILPQMERFVELVEQKGPGIADILKQTADEIDRSADRMFFLAEATGKFISLISGIETKTGLISFLSRVVDYLNPVTLAIDQLQRGIRGIEGFIRGVNPDVPPPAPQGRTILPGAEAFRQFGIGDPAQRMAMGLLPGLPDSPGSVRSAISRDTAPDAKAVREAARRAGEVAKAYAAETKEVFEMVTKITKGAADGLKIIADDLQKALIENKRKRAEDAEFIKKRLAEGRETRTKLTEEFSNELQRGARRDLSRSGRSIGDLVSRGAVTPEQAEALTLLANRDYANQLREVLAIEQTRKGVSQARLDDLKDEISLYDQLGTAISDSERFMRGFNSATISLGDAFERFGQNVSQALLNTRDLLNGLKNAVLQFFNDLLGRSLQNLTRQVLSPLIGGLGGIFGQPAIASLFGGGGGTLAIPPSISAIQEARQFFTDIAGPATRPRTVTGVSGVGGSAIRSGFSFGAFSQSLAAAAPLFGLSLGSSLGGQSTLGQILGAGAGLGLGLGISFAAPLLAEGGLAALGPAALAFAGPAAFIAAPLIVGAILAGKAAQRKKDEEASGVMLTQALDAINQLKAGIASDQIAGSQAKSIFDNQILGTFIQQINTLKTESVRKSRLTNQVRDLRGVYDAIVVPEVDAQIKRRRDAARFSAIDSRRIPQFAIGGISQGGGLAWLHPREMILTPAHQAAIAALAGQDIFKSVGVPGVQPNAVFDRGGIYAGPSAVPSSSPPIINLYLGPLVGQKDAEEILAIATDSTTGRRLLVNTVQRGLRGR